MWLGVGKLAAIAVAIAGSVCTNFVLNRRFTFSHSKDQPILKQFLTYVSSVSVGTAINYLVTLFLVSNYPAMKVQFASILGIAAATIFNFMAMKFVVFKRKFYKSSK